MQAFRSFICMHGEHDNPGLHEGAIDVLADRLVREAGVTKEQARELIRLIGIDWNSLLREAYFLKKRAR
ncbi:hypothetical protein [Mesorhizobium sp. M1D.F.Ca.ET.043.01.1.1]|uniref:hypothetical protein n=1 Tax=Mesorhizobium sp. M1D.F.Ca.ET.043.01.1.1 TaxID=2493669 RepID=UPI001FE09410|nr:hypothetical protein [Mesorhizobium sp. M1D.F.Ca.ET.043.01.1.1]